VKLSKAQRQTLEKISRQPFGLLVWVAGRQTCEGLRKRGLIEVTGGDRRIHRHDGNPLVEITEAGRAALTSGDG
jgi:hypothetical protein